MTIYDFTVKDAKGQDVSLADYKGKVLLIVLDFPCNQFGNQAPGTEEEIVSFCKLNYGTTFKQFAKIDVNGDNEAPLYTYLKSEEGGFLSKKIKWNFTKFLVDRKGEVEERYAPTVTPEKLENDIRELLYT